MSARKPRKRYGPVKNRGYWQPEGGWKSCRKPTRYVVSIGTECTVQSPGSREWRKHTTRETVITREVFFRDEEFLVLKYRGWKIRVKSEDVCEE